MADDDDTDKSFDPTPKKLEDARKKGEIAKSTDLNATAAYGGFLLVLVTVGPWSAERASQAMARFFAEADTLADLALSKAGPGALSGAFAEIAISLAPVFALPALLVLVTILGQRALIFVPSRIAPKLSRISVLSNAKQKFGRAGLFEFAKSFTKLSVFSILLALLLYGSLSQIIGLAHMETAWVMISLFDLTEVFFGQVFLVALVIGALDYLFQSAEHIRKNRMSFKDLQDEAKMNEGDPHTKQQRRQKGYEIAMNQMMADVDEADVVLVNPTHYAVALKWDRLSGGAPVCVARGVDHVALAIRERAMEAGVAIRHDPPTARALYASLKIGDEVLPEHYKPVAAAIRFAERLRRMKGGLT